jgi:GTP-binding protein EngB required for normal cell division
MSPDTSDRGTTVPKAAEPETTPNLEKLRAYTQARQALEARLRVLRTLLKERGSEPRAEVCRELMAKLAEDRFTLAVLGQFKRGKSSLMNAIIGRDLLPTGVLPVTSAITILRFGPTGRLVVRRKDSVFLREEPLSALADLVTEEGNPGNQKAIESVSVELPLPFLRRGLEFVDTPGVGSAIEANTATTHAFVPQCDAVLFVTAVDAPLTAIEIAFLQRIRQHVHKLFLVVNKTDLLAEDARGELLAFVVRTLQAHTGAEDVRVFPVSSRLGLQGKAARDPAAYEHSGLKDLETALADFLSSDRASTFLRAVEAKAARLASEELGELGIPNRADDGEQGALDQKLDEMARQIRPATSQEEAGAHPAGAAGAGAAGAVARLRASGCPVCGHLAQLLSDFLVKLQAQLARDPESRARFAADLGLCPLHSWQLEGLTSPHASSLAFAELSERVARELTLAPDIRQGVHGLLRTSRTCRACLLLRQAETQDIQALAQLLQQASGREAYARSDGLCLPHLGLLGPTVSDAGVLAFLVTKAQRLLEALAEDMRSYAVKHEALRRGLLNENESRAYRRAISLIVGRKELCLVPEPEE